MSVFNGILMITRCTQFKKRKCKSIEDGVCLWKDFGGGICFPCPCADVKMVVLG